MHHETELIAALSLGLSVAFFCGLLASRAKLPPLVGYLLAGILIGPYTPGFVADAGIASQLAEIGVILLMFGVGLHFSIKDLLAVRGIALPGAIIQITFATLLGMGLAHLWGWPWGQGLVFGLCLSVASTVVLLKALEERDAVSSFNGQISVGWLVVEDLITVLALVLLPALSGLLGGVESSSSQSIGMTLLLTLGKVGLFSALMLIVGSKVVPWLLERVVKLKSRELFTLAVLAIALGIAYMAATVFGVSFALGAFFAGMIVSESRLSHQAAAEALPLQDAFAVLFFVSVGMLFDYHVLYQNPLAVLLTTAIIVVGKGLGSFAVVKALRYPTATALFVSAALAQIGEFSFILAGLGISLKLLPAEALSLILAGAILSIVLNPFMFRIAQQWAVKREHLPAATHQEGLPDTIIVGYGRVGQMIAQELQAKGQSYRVIEQNRALVETLRREGVPAFWGNASEPLTLDECGVDEAKWLYVATPDPLEARLMVEQARSLNPDIQMIVRSHDEQERQSLLAAGADVVLLAEAELGKAMAQAEGAAAH